MEMSTNRTRVVVKHPGKSPTIELIAPGFEAVKRIVDGWFECAMKAHGYFGDGDLVAYVNDEGLVRTPPMDLNLLRPTDGHPLAGPIVVVKVDARGEDVSMTETEAALAIELLSGMREAA